MQQTLLKILDFGTIVGVCGYWLSIWIYRALLICLLGGCIGVLLTPLLKLVFFQNRDWLLLFQQSFTIGFQYFGVWAGGVSVVWLVMDRKRIMRGLYRLFPSNLDSR
jgi:hypothetical protein